MGAADSLAIQSLRSKLQQLNMQVATAGNSFTLTRALQEYIATANKLANAVEPTIGAAQVAAPFIPGGTILTAAVGGTGNIGNKYSGG